MFRKIRVWLKTAAIAAFISMVFNPVAMAAEIAQVPLFLSKTADPLVMLQLSRDHQLFYKAYNDYSDIDDDGIAETTYKHDFEYYGYFDSLTCYTYTGGVFVASSDASANEYLVDGVTKNPDFKYCNLGAASGEWSGNFLNWLSMSRMDVVRKVLYGGYRSTDTASQTVLERTSLPNDAHSWAKYYKGADVAKLTPFGSSVTLTDNDLKKNGLTFCNTTFAPNADRSQSTTQPPLIRVAKGNYSLWASNERWQCLWQEEIGGKSAGGGGNSNTAASGIDAYNSSPNNAGAQNKSLGAANYYARVAVCKQKAANQFYGGEAASCFRYEYEVAGTPYESFKPHGLLQQYASTVRFGLLTGSYNKNISGGVLHKNISLMGNEINANGTFNKSGSSLIGAIDALRMYGYNYGNGTYIGGGTVDDCNFQQTSFVQGKCRSWGNPLSEMFLETIRYFANKGTTVATPAFDTDDSTVFPGLKVTAWNAPLNTDNYCASLNTIVFNASVSSYDGDQLGGFSALPDQDGKDLNAWVNLIGETEGINGKSVFIGQIPATPVDEISCSPKTLAFLSDAKGVCPEAPTSEGTYNVAGLAYYARVRDLRDDLADKQQLNTYAVALSPAVPRIDVVVARDASNKPTKVVSILPSYVLKVGGQIGAGTLVDFKVISQTATTGTYYINWEDSEQGGDYDQDIWGVLKWTLIGTAGNYTGIKIETDAIAESTVNPQGFGYVISGTTKDGFHAHSGIEGYNFIDATGALGCNNCQVGNAMTAYTYDIGANTTALLMEQPLYYAAKFGGFIDANGNNKPEPVGDPIAAQEWDKDKNTIPDNYFYVTDPSKLVSELSKVLNSIAKQRASAASVAANSVSLGTETTIYQAVFNSGVWEGDLMALNIDPTTGAVGVVKWQAATKLNSKTWSTRQIVTYDPINNKGIPFEWSALNAVQQAAMNINPDNLATDGRGEDRVNHLRGDTSNELRQGSQNAVFRSRDSLLGDIVGSTPVYVGNKASRYRFNGIRPADYYAFAAGYAGRQSVVYAGANDGMLHAFDAATGEELFAYVPSQIFNKLNELTSNAYAHQFYVDGDAVAADAYVDQLGGWATVLVGSLRGGGKGFYALNITNPAQFTTGNAASAVMWEVNADTDPDMGYSYSRPNIVRLENGKWGAVFSNGYKSVSGKAVLYILDIGDGSIIKKITVPSTGTNGLSSPVLVDIDDDGIADTAYAGDLRGNLWKFNLSSSNATDWTAVSHNGTVNEPFFVAKDAAGNRQPITSRPTAGGDKVLFGTGKYYEEGDDADASPQTQTFYGVTTYNSSVPTSTITRDALVAQTITTQEMATIEGLDADGKETSVTQEVRLISNNTVGSSSMGWYMDLVYPAGSASVGERVVTNPQYFFGRIMFATLIPSVQPCEAGGTGWLMTLDAETGKEVPGGALDSNGDGLINSRDKYKGQYVGGSFSPNGIPQPPTIIVDTKTNTIKLYSVASDGSLIALPIDPSNNPAPDPLCDTNGDGVCDCKDTNTCPPGGGGGGGSVVPPTGKGPAGLGRNMWHQVR
ncbi:MAG: hypothetical protein H0W44_03480 [Gammaproteobacteria bacterium]|nr:hypothetical protein [Gammaproteobacteria bacterium]